MAPDDDYHLLDQPSLRDIARRLERVEEKLDQRIATMDMLHASEKSASDTIAAVEKLFEAKIVALGVEIKNNADGLRRVETVQTRIILMLAGAFVGIIVQIIILVAQGKP